MARKYAESTKALFKVLSDGKIHSRKELVMAMVKAKYPDAKDENYFEWYRGTNTASIAWHSGVNYSAQYVGASHPDAKMDNLGKGKYQINEIGRAYLTKLFPEGL